MSPRLPIKPLALVLLAASLGACSLHNPAPAKTAVALNNEDWYQVRTDNELFVFDDYQVFRDFLDTGKAPYLKDLQRKDKHGQSIILALRAEDQGKQLEQIAAYQFLNVSLPPANPFYGEIRQHGVIYVFQRYGDMMDTFSLGEPIFRHTEIASGPQGERVVYGLTKEESKPLALIDAFQARYKR
ncbi:hypothetical protein SBP02_06595 [Pseudomonas benzenivorans]|uniref:Uncharacterized protein n=1 Tax=Pseudomonas benzenivorans TaxID=556533 RepID=A0ABZ0PYW5_9PSED|nr:hypothetical protein [Pseudomonas benzenivorans]WPC06420.1 hypothetical protein SBP02_06595 [Pseudomonas benzenivorans]